MRIILLFMVTFMLLINSALSEQAFKEAIYTQIPLWPQSIEAWNDSAFLLAGRSTDSPPGESLARIMILDSNGQLLWQYDEDKISGWCNYEFAYQLSEDTSIVVLENDSEIYIDLISQDKKVNRSGPFSLAAARCISTNARGVLICGNPESEYATQLVQTDKHGNILWTKEFNEYIVLKKIIPHEGINYAYGHEIHGTNEDFVAVVIAIDENGKLLWKHISPNEETYTAGAISENGEFLVSSIIETSDHTPSLSCYNESGLLWQSLIPKSHTLIQETEVNTGKICSITTRDNGFLVACKGICAQGSGIWLYEIDINGSILAEKCYFIDQISNFERCDLLQLNGSTFLLIQGVIDSVESYDWWNISSPTLADFPRGIYIVKVDSIV